MKNDVLQLFESSAIGLYFVEDISPGYYCCPSCERIIALPELNSYMAHINSVEHKPNCKLKKLYDEVSK